MDAAACVPPDQSLWIDIRLIRNGVSLDLSPARLAASPPHLSFHLSKEFAHESFLEKAGRPAWRCLHGWCDWRRLFTPIHRRLPERHRRAMFSPRIEDYDDEEICRSIGDGGDGGSIGHNHRQSGAACRLGFSDSSGDGSFS